MLLHKRASWSRVYFADYLRYSAPKKTFSASFVKFTYNWIISPKIGVFIVVSYLVF